MGVSISVVDRISEGNRKVIVADVTMDSSYPTGGESMTAGDLGLQKVSMVQANPNAGYIPEYDHTNSKLKVYRQKDPANAGGADIPLPEVGSTVDLSAVVFRVMATGY